MVNESVFFILKAAKALAKLYVLSNTHININLDLTEIERKRQKKLILDRNMQNESLKSNMILTKFYNRIRKTIRL